MLRPMNSNYIYFDMQAAKWSQQLALSSHSHSVRESDSKFVIYSD